MPLASTSFYVATVLCASIWWLASGIGPGERALVSWQVASAWPLGPHVLANASRAIGSLVFSAALLLLYTALGLRLLHWLGVRRVSTPLKVAAPLLAYPLVSTALMGLSCLGLWYPSALWSFLVIVALVGVADVGDALDTWRRGLGSLWNAFPGWSIPLVVAGTGWWILLQTPPELDIDCLTYHLAFPQQLLTTHRMFGADVHSHWSIPLVHEFPGVFPLLAGVDESIRQIGLAQALLGVLVLVYAAFPALSPPLALVAALTALCLPAARYVLATGKNDAVACGYLAAGAGLMLHSGIFSRRILRWTALVVGAWLVGVATAMKYLMLPLSVFLGVVAFYRCEHRTRWRAGFLTAGLMLAPIIPWCLKAWCYIADPLYPVGTVAFPSLFGDQHDSAKVRAVFANYVGRTRRKVDLPKELVWVALRNTAGFLAAIPLLLASGIAGLGALLTATALGCIGIMGGINGAIEHTERFADPAFTLVNAVGLGALLSSRSSRARLSVVLVIVLSALTQFRVMAAEWWPGGTWQTNKPAGAYLAGRLTPDEFRVQGMLGYGIVVTKLRQQVENSKDHRAVLVPTASLLWDIPARVRINVFDPPVLWRTITRANSAERISIRFRQLNIGWIMHNTGLGALARYTYSPYGWDPASMRLYADWAVRHLEPLVSDGRCDPAWGSNVLYAVHLDRPAKPLNKRLAVLPGTESLCAYAAIAQLNKRPDVAIRRYRQLRTTIPEVIWYDSLLADALVQAGMYAEAYPLARGAALAGEYDETVYLDWAVTAGRTGHRLEAKQALRRAAEVYPLWPERVAAASELAFPSVNIPAVRR